MADRTKQGFFTRGISLFRMLHVRRRRVVLLIMLAVALAVLEGIGVGLLNPVLQYVQYGTVKSSGVFGTLLLDLIDALGLPVDLITLLIFAFIPVLLRQVAYFAYFWSTARVQQAAATRMRADGFAALVNSDLPFIVGEGFGNLVSTLTVQVHRGSQALFAFLQQISTGLVIVMYVVVLLVLDWRLALMAVAAIAVISWLVKGAVTRSRALGAETVKRNRETYSVIGERITALRLIKMLGQEGSETRKVKNVVQALADAQVRIAVFAGIIEVTIDPLLMFTVFAIIYVGVQYFGADLATLGLFLFILLRLNQKAKDFNGLRQSISAQIDSLITVRDVIERAIASRHIRGGQAEVLRSAREHPFRERELRLPDQPRSSSSRAWTSRSPADRRPPSWADRAPASPPWSISSRVSARRPARILFDGVPIQEFDLRSLRRAIGFMTQDAILFDDTVYNNLVYGLDREPSREEVEQALESGYCSQFVYDLPNELETRVGDRGIRLSGGQRQRLALARVFLQDPDILILDEPTSALDSESEEYIQKALESVRHHKTLIVIAHRLSTVQHSDQIVVLDYGSIVERGAHDELLAAEGAYHRLFDLQIYH